jgi:gas vesicle protein
MKKIYILGSFLFAFFLQSAYGSAGLPASAPAASSSSCAAPTSAPSAPRLNAPKLMPDMNALDPNDLKRIRELQAYDERKINNPENDQLLTDENFAKQFSSDPRYKEYYNDDYDSVATENLIKGPSGYTQLLHAVHLGDDSLEYIINAMLNIIIEDPQGKNPVTTDIRIALGATFNGLNAYQYAAYLAHKYPSGKRTRIKLMLRDILAADLPFDIRSIMPREKKEFLQKSPEINYNTVILVKFRDTQYQNLFASLSTDEQINDFFKKRFNVRFLLFSSLPDISNVDLIKPLFFAAIEQGESIQNLQELVAYFLTLKLNDWFRIPLVQIQEVLNELELNYAKPNLQMIPAVVLENILIASTDHKVKDFKEAIDNFVVNSETNPQVRADLTLKLNKALGSSSLENIDLVDTENGYNPLLYAIYKNNRLAVQYITNLISLNIKLKVKNKETIETLNKQLKEIKTQLAKLAQSNKEQKAKDEVEKELKDKKTSLEKQLEELNKKLQINELVLQSLERKVNGLNAYCLAKNLGHKEIVELLAPLFKDECPK